MAILHCRHCGNAIDSDARHTQCRECRSLFPFECAVCQRQLRSPFPVFGDERHLTVEEPPLPLCDDHFLRQCPDCQTWFQYDENPGYFRCLVCAAKAHGPARLELSDALPETDDAYDGSYGDNENSRGMPLVVGARIGFEPNTLVLGAAGCAFLALIGWFLLGHSR